MKLSNITYQRPDIEAIKDELTELLHRFETAQTVAIQNKVLKRFNQIRLDYKTQGTLCSLDSPHLNIPNREEEALLYRKKAGQLGQFTEQLYGLIIASPFKQDLEAQWGTHFMNLAQLYARQGTEQTQQLEEEESDLDYEYAMLLRKATFDWEGKTINFDGLRAFRGDKDKEVRKKAGAMFFGFFEKNEPELQRICMRLLAVRHQIAQSEGFKNYIKQGYIDRQRIDLHTDQVKLFRQWVKKYFVPILTRLKAQQKGNATLSMLMQRSVKPKGNADYIIEKMHQTMESLSPELGTFFKKMEVQQRLDVENRMGKAPVDFCTPLWNYAVPYVQMTFNGTESDVKTFLHELGHAFQFYQSADKGKEWLEFLGPPSHIAEIHSTALEFLTWDYHHLFFEGETPKYQYKQLVEQVRTIVRGCMVDEFQHHIYANPALNPAQISAVYTELHKSYGLYDEESTNEWKQQGHHWIMPGSVALFQPFQVIAYSFAGIGALQLLNKYKDKPTAAMQTYLTICQTGGSQPFLSLLKMANLESPFEESCMKEVAEMVETQLAAFDF